MCGPVLTCLHAHAKLLVWERRHPGERGTRGAKENWSVTEGTRLFVATWKEEDGGYSWLVDLVIRHDGVTV